MSAQSLEPYLPTGKLSISLVWKFVILAAVMIGLGYISSQLIVNFPFVFVAFPLFLIRFFLVTLGSVYLVRWSKVRNSAMGLLTGLLLGLIAWGSSWVLLFPGMLQNHDIHLTSLEFLVAPELFSQNLPLIISNGWYRVMDYSINGYLIQTAWIVELAVLLIYPAYKGFEATKNRLFCESCNQWAENQGGMLAFYYQDDDKLAKDFQSASFEFMDTAEAIYNVPMKDYYQINSEVCVACNDLFALSLYQMKKATDLDKAKPRPIYEKLLVKRAYFQHLLMLRSQYPAPQEN